MGQLGWKFPSAGDSCCGETCVPNCTDIGTTGSESGSECSACGSTIINDTFSAALDSAWASGPAPCSGTIGPSGWRTSGGILIPGTGNIIRPFTRPALSGFCVQVKVTVVTKGHPFEACGIVLAFGPSFFQRVNFSNYGRQSCTNAGSCVAVGSDFATFGPNPADGDVVSFIVRDQGGGDNGDGSVDCSICYQVNGTTVRVTEDVTTCFPDPMYAGIVGNASAGSQTFDNFQVLTN